MPEAMLKRELLAILCCPKCKGDLDERTEQASLRCLRCGAVYPVKEGIPIMLVEDTPQSEQEPPTVRPAPSR